MIITIPKTSPNTGKYYFETLIGAMPAGVVWVGIGDSALSQTTSIGLAGWSISSHSRTFNKQTGGGTVWGGGARIVSEMKEMIGVIVMLELSIASSLAWRMI